MHRYSSETDRLAQKVIDHALRRIRMDPPPLDGPQPADVLARVAGKTITEDGLGGDEALRLFSDVLTPATISTDHPRFLAFVPGAPTEASILADLLVGASSIYGGSWLEGAGLVHAENETIRFLCDEAGLPEGAGGVFVSGGTAGNLSALVTARDRARRERPDHTGRWTILASEEAHSSVEAAARVMDCDVALVPTDSHRRMTGPAVAQVLADLDPDVTAGCFAVTATSGTTNLGVIDDLASLADACDEHGLWFHVDGAYGGAGLLAPSVRDRFDGIERADSIIIDPHKWLFAPYDCCALLWKSPDDAVRAHTQHAGYLDTLEYGSMNPSDLAHHLSRRARGIPLWFSLATHGVAAYRAAIEVTIELATTAAELIEASPVLEVVGEPSLSIVCFRRIGWTSEQYQEWSDLLLRRGLAFVTPSAVDGETVLRFCFINPLTTSDDIELILSTLAD